METDNRIELVNNDYEISIENQEYQISVENIINTDYQYSSNKPSINSIELNGNLNSDDLNLASKTDLSTKENISNKVNRLDINSAEVEYPTAKCVFEALQERANLDLDNISENGKNAFTNISASNLNTEGKSYLAGLGMPSSKYIDLTLGTSGSRYTAPANGWFSILATNGGANYLLQMQCNNLLFTTRTGNATNSIGVSCPATKGANMILSYDGLNSTSYFRFIYAEGEA